MTKVCRSMWYVTCRLQTLWNCAMTIALLLRVHCKCPWQQVRVPIAQTCLIEKNAHWYCAHGLANLARHLPVPMESGNTHYIVLQPSTVTSKCVNKEQGFYVTPIAKKNQSKSNEYKYFKFTKINLLNSSDTEEKMHFNSKSLNCLKILETKSKYFSRHTHQ